MGGSDDWINWPWDIKAVRCIERLREGWMGKSSTLLSVNACPVVALALLRATASEWEIIRDLSTLSSLNN